jgi:hypothetical protein
MFFRPEAHCYNGCRPEISVEIDDGGPMVYLTIEAVPLETIDDADIGRILLPDEARAFAAMLWHCADMAERK